MFVSKKKYEELMERLSSLERQLNELKSEKATPAVEKREKESDQQPIEIKFGTASFAPEHEFRPNEDYAE